ncbi:hypothetical protein XENOCAPTIV_016516 [Xenoophorus captivus]|uniref:Uncharacterized protein n=1 Tax=Xenoophorus captivus TaxID=1517983 RepID=A0ABV0SI41_9TELE
MRRFADLQSTMAPLLTLTQLFMVSVPTVSTRILLKRSVEDPDMKASARIIAQRTEHFLPSLPASANLLIGQLSHGCHGGPQVPAGGRQDVTPEALSFTMVAAFSHRYSNSTGDTASSRQQRTSGLLTCERSRLLAPTP